MRIGINGMGRIGRLALRAAMGGMYRASDDPRAGNRLDVVHVNELKGGAATTAHLLEFDSIHGRWRTDFGSDDRWVSVAGKRIGFSDAPTPDAVPWGDLGCDMVLECTGKFLTTEALAGYFARGVKRVIVAAPVKEAGALNIVVGVNDHLYDPTRHLLLTAASCTTNCLAPVVKVLHEAVGIRHGQITTIHDPTNTNVVVDAPHKDLRRARSAMQSLSPTTTGSATAIALIYPELKGKLNGHAIRAPVLNASLTDCVFEMSRPVTEAEVNALFRTAANGPLAGILGFETRPLVSADYANDTRSAIVDGPSTMVTDDTMVKIYAWYDNEAGYACRMVDLANIVIDRSA
ncbi:MAG: ArsJ-associated glyceraldehyde-3-phosphate dehydrogenase [Rhodopila sp.]|nr:ArsJ-associated glyceraldehyde-3-phosphate dehydrogenase [Rhodopila sp.]